MALDEYGGYWYNSNLPQHWGQGQQYSSNEACIRACKNSGDSGCGNCGYSEPPNIQKLEAPQTPPQPITLNKGIDPNERDVVLKYIILAGIALIILSWS